jgi:hypothetical protein
MDLKNSKLYSTALLFSPETEITIFGGTTSSAGTSVRKT